jgi:hypothetical protein
MTIFLLAFIFLTLCINTISLFFQILWATRNTWCKSPLNGVEGFGADIIRMKDYGLVEVCPVRLISSFSLTILALNLAFVTYRDLFWLSVSSSLERATKKLYKYFKINSSLPTYFISSLLFPTSQKM